MTTSTPTDPFAGKELWFLTGSQSLYGDDTLRQVADQAGQVVAALDAAPGIPVRIVPKPVLTTSDAIRRACLDATTDDRCIGVMAWMHTFSPAKMWIGGLQALGKPLLHLHTQANQSLPWSTIDMDFMNLNQAAHGDREFGFVQTRMGIERNTVFGHVDDPEVQAAVGRWARAATGWHAMRHLRLARFGDNMRDVAVTEGDKVEAEIRFGVSVNTWGVNDLVDAVAEVPDGAVDALVAEYGDLYDMDDDLRPGGDRHESVRVAARIEAGLRAFLTDGGFGAFTTNFEDLGGLRQLPGLGVQRLMADGYGFGGEGDWKTVGPAARREGHGPRPPGRHVLHGGLHVPPRPGHPEDPRRPHARGVPDHRGRPTPPRGPPALDRRSRGPGPAGVRRRTRTGRRRRPGRHRQPLPPRRQRDRHGRARRAAALAARRPCGVDLAARPAHVDDLVAHGRRPAPHRVQQCRRP